MKRMPMWGNRAAKYIVISGLLISGYVHLDIVPFHFSHMPAHGIFFGVLGVFQLFAIFLFWLRPHRFVVMWLIFSITGGMVLLWGVTQMDFTPFTRSAEPIDSPTIITKLAEIIAFIASIFHFGRLVPKHILKGLALSVVTGIGTLALGYMAEYFAGGPPKDPHGFPLANGHGGTVHSHGIYDNYYTDDYSWNDVFKSLKGYLTPQPKSSYVWNLPTGFPEPRVPAENPMTEEKVKLGRYLFYDKRLSGNGTVSCSSCHFQSKAFTDGKVLPEGSTGMVHPRNSLSLTNSAYSSTLTWANPSLENLEKQILIPMFGEFPVELGIVGKEEEVRNRFRNDTLYKRLFAQAFPEKDRYHFTNFAKALASFTRTIISGSSRYDRYVYKKDSTALNDKELRGMQLFFSEKLECHHCHGGFNFTLSTVHKNTVFIERPFHNTGLFDLDGRGAYPDNNTGIMEITGNPNDMGKFRAPTLRNIELTAPYMHDGSMSSLDEVIDFYKRGGRSITKGEFKGDGKESPLKSGFVSGFELSDSEKEELIAFLKTLTDEEFIQNKELSNPF
ncbi:MAG: MbnH family di-heme enzyme [Bacteroidota bacterium]